MVGVGLAVIYGVMMGLVRRRAQGMDGHQYRRNLTHSGAVIFPAISSGRINADGQSMRS